MRRLLILCWMLCAFAAEAATVIITNWSQFPTAVPSGSDVILMQKGGINYFFTPNQLAVQLSTNESLIEVLGAAGISNALYAIETVRNAAVSNSVVALELTRNAAVSNALVALIGSSGGGDVTTAQLNAASNVVTSGIASKQSGSFLLTNFLAMGISNIVASTGIAIGTNQGSLVITNTGGAGNDTNKIGNLNGLGTNVTVYTALNLAASALPTTSNGVDVGSHLLPVRTNWANDVVGKNSVATSKLTSTNTTGIPFGVEANGALSGKMSMVFASDVGSTSGGGGLAFDRTELTNTTGITYKDRGAAKWFTGLDVTTTDLVLAYSDNYSGDIIRLSTNGNIIFAKGSGSPLNHIAFVTMFSPNTNALAVIGDLSVGNALDSYPIILTRTGSVFSGSHKVSTESGPGITLEKSTSGGRNFLRWNQGTSWYQQGFRGSPYTLVTEYQSSAAVPDNDSGWTSLYAVTASGSFGFGTSTPSSSIDATGQVRGASGIFTNSLRTSILTSTNTIGIPFAVEANGALSGKMSMVFASDVGSVSGGGGLAFDRTELTNTTGIFYKDRGTVKWFTGLDIATPDLVLAYSESLSGDILRISTNGNILFAKGAGSPSNNVAFVTMFSPNTNALAVVGDIRVGNALDSYPITLSRTGTIDSAAHKVATDLGPGLTLEKSTSAGRNFLRWNQGTVWYQSGFRADPYTWVLEYQSSATPANDTGWTSIMSATTSGNVGIGVAAPNSKLEISYDASGQSTLRLNNLFGIVTSPGAYGFGRLSGMNSGNGLLLSQNVNIGGGGLGSTLDDPANNGYAINLGEAINSGIAFLNYAAGAGTVTPTVSMFVKNTGNVGIGTTSPTNRFDNVGNTSLRSNVWISGSLFAATNAANYNIVTNNFSLDTYYTNSGARAWVSASIGMTNVLLTEKAWVGLYLDQDGDGTWERTGINVRLQGISALAGTEQLNAFLQPSARFIFTNLGTVANAAIEANSSQWVRQ